MVRFLRTKLLKTYGHKPSTHDPIPLTLNFEPLAAHPEPSTAIYQFVTMPVQPSPLAHQPTPFNPNILHVPNLIGKRPVRKQSCILFHHYNALYSGGKALAPELRPEFTPTQDADALNAEMIRNRQGFRVQGFGFRVYSFGLRV